MFLFQTKDFKILFATSEFILKEIDNLITKNNYSASQVVTLNLLIYFQTKVDKTAYSALKNAKLVICDSFGVALVCSVFSFRFLRHQPGIELIDKLCKERKYKIYLLGSTQKVVEEAKNNLVLKYNANIVGSHHGYIFSSEELLEEVLYDIEKKSPDILLVGLPTELQESWIWRNLNKLKCKVVIGVGGSFDVISGKLKRAPKVFRILGLEWFFRLVQQPWRFLRIIKLPLALALLFFDCLSSKLKKYGKYK